MSMSTVLGRNENQTLLAARMVQDYYFPKREKNIPDWILIFAVRDLLEHLPETTPEDLFDLLITQSGIRAHGHLSHFLATSLVTGATVGTTPARNSLERSVFTGARKFSFEKIAAMTAYITSRGQKTCKAQLNKFLFYSDFVNYFLYDQSISGAKYVRHLGGPVLHRYESILKTLMFSGIIDIKGDHGNEEIIACDESIIGELTTLETVTMYWVLVNFGSMSASELAQYSQREGAYRYTRQDEYIAYEYAQILQKLPARSLFRRFASNLDKSS